MSFRINAVGRLATDPEKGEKGECRFSLLSSDYAGADKPKVVTRVWFVAFGTYGDTIAKNCRRGDQLIVEARHVASRFERDGETEYRYNNIVDRFEFGAPGKARREKGAAVGAKPAPIVPPDRNGEPFTVVKACAVNKP